MSRRYSGGKIYYECPVCGDEAWVFEYFPCNLFAGLAHTDRNICERVINGRKQRSISSEHSHQNITHSPSTSNQEEKVQVKERRISSEYSHQNITHSPSYSTSNESPSSTTTLSQITTSIPNLNLSSTNIPNLNLSSFLDVIHPQLSDMLVNAVKEMGPNNFREITGKYAQVDVGVCKHCGHTAITRFFGFSVNSDCYCCNQKDCCVFCKSTNLSAIPHELRFCKNKPESCLTSYSHKLNIIALNELVVKIGFSRTDVIQTMIDARNDEDLTLRLLNGEKYDSNWIPDWFMDLLKQSPRPNSQPQSPRPNSQSPRPNSQSPRPISQSPRPNSQSQPQSPRPDSQSKPQSPRLDSNKDYVDIPVPPNYQPQSPRQEITKVDTPSPQVSPRGQLTILSTEQIKKRYFIEPHIINWTSEKVIGEGGFGTVELAEINGSRSPWSTTVACKVIVPNDNSMVGNKIISALVYREIEMMGDLAHGNILKFYGYTYKKDHKDKNGVKLVIVMEYMELGSLDRSENLSILNDTLCLKLANQIVDGMIYLHSKNIIHRDLAPSNILLTGHINNLTAKVGDLGLSRLLNPEDHTSSVGQFRYMAPEVFYKPSIYTQKSDVYSFGMVLWFMFTKEPPFKDLDQKFGNITERINYITSAVIEGMRPEIPNCFLDFLITNCFKSSGECRPTFEEIKTQLTVFI